MKSYKIVIVSAESLCKPNTLLGSHLYNYLKANKHEIVLKETKADYVVVNSCGFDEWHERYSLELANYYKKKMINVIVIGCLVKINENSLKRIKNITVLNNFDDLDKIFYTTTKFNDVSSALTGYESKFLNYKQKNERVKLRSFQVFIFKRIATIFEKIGLKKNIPKQIVEEIRPHNNLLVKIGSGCMGNCSYCIIKKARVSLNSIPIKDIILDIKNKIDKNKRENIYLVADDCGCYGFDIDTNIFELIKSLNKEFPNNLIDICYLSGNWMLKNAQKYLELFSSGLINSVNITVQSGSPRILKLMNRNPNISKLLRIIQDLRKVSPNTIIWTHYLVGFPSETYRDFLYSLYSMRFFDHSFIFKYSDMEGTQSSLLPNKISQKSKFLREKLLGLVNLIYIFKKIIFTITIKK